jgi:hypothetical protein
VVVGVARVQDLQVEAGKFEAKFVGYAISGGSSQNRLNDAQSDGESRNGGNQAKQHSNESEREEERREEREEKREKRRDDRHKKWAHKEKCVVVVARA